MARPTNEELIRRNRRRRTDNLGETALKLTTHDSLDHENFEYRWIKDDGSRMHQKTVADDWEIVTQDDDSVKEDAAVAMGTGVAVRSGVNKDGAALNLYLCRKPKVLAEDDRAAREAQRKKLDDQMRRGALPTPGGATGDAFYTPSGNRIS